MLERSRGHFAGRFFEFAYKLPSVERVKKVDVSGSSVKDLEGEIGSVFHVNAGRLLVGIASVFEFHFFHSVLILLAH